MNEELTVTEAEVKQKLLKDIQNSNNPEEIKAYTEAIKAIDEGKATEEEKKRLEKELIIKIFEIILTAASPIIGGVIVERVRAVERIRLFNMIEPFETSNSFTCVASKGIKDWFKI